MDDAVACTSGVASLSAASDSHPQGLKVECHEAARWLPDNQAAGGAPQAAEARPPRMSKPPPSKWPPLVRTKPTSVRSDPTLPCRAWRPHASNAIVNAQDVSEAAVALTGSSKNSAEASQVEASSKSRAPFAKARSVSGTDGNPKPDHAPLRKRLATEVAT